ncbi:MAG: cobH 1 [Firmicutes bacterium]|nr:cobH 1 [Bacillota bacterium]
MMDFIKDPMTIENRSMEIIAPYLSGLNLSPTEVRVYSRMIHASGDPDYANWIHIEPNAIEKGRTALESGKDIFCDVEMVRTGINKRRLAEYGGEAHCLISAPHIAEEAKKRGITRAMASMREFGEKLDGAIVAIGNAPTALFEVLKMMEETDIRPALIVGVPVGFVGAKESKDLLIETSPVSYISVAGHKGGSSIAASVINALLYLSGR